MRIMIKGGVWKNSEDEILKVAVMKYGLNQWARISSLLVRKSAKQCKARWYEWLDPAIKKTEWTREEDEKLLHLAKLFPQQWRTIAPIVGRTPAQCLERYEKLLDEAINKDARYEAGDDPRRLRPGEIDPNPESKPARPDPVDMDEDEKEMLAEARARLANTRGKKAKRKAREKLLFEAKRLAQLQKNRELRNAGLGMRGPRHGGSKSIDYNNEVPFEQKPPPGFYDTATEIDKTKSMQQQFRPSTLEQLEGKRRKDLEAQLIKQDMKKQKLKEGHEAPMPQEDGLEAKGRRQRKLMLPAPQVSERELMQIARLGSGDRGSLFLEQQQQQEEKRQTALNTLRTPRSSVDKVALEAENQGRLLTAQTPLLGGENPLVHPSDFTGVTPRSYAPNTPNPLGVKGQTQEEHSQGQDFTRTPSVAGTPMMTPSRSDEFSMRSMSTNLGSPQGDQLGINDQKLSQKHIQARMRNQLMSDLVNVPQPMHEYAMQVPEIEEEMRNGDVRKENYDILEDAADRDQRLIREKEQHEQDELKKRSQVLQRSLPRPPSQMRSQAAASGEESSARSRATDMLDQEMRKLIDWDNARYPVRKDKENRSGGKRKRGKEQEQMLPNAQEIIQVDVTHLKEAALLIEQEIDFVKKQMGHDQLKDVNYMEAWQQVVNEFSWMNDKKEYQRINTLESAERVQRLKQEFEDMQDVMRRESRKGRKLEEKVNILTKGFQIKQTEQEDRAKSSSKRLSVMERDYESYAQLHVQELRAMSARKTDFYEKIERLRQQEIGLQKQYKEMESMRQDLMTMLSENK